MSNCNGTDAASVTGPFPWSRRNESIDRRGVSIDRFADFDVSCPHGYGLSSIAINPGQCDLQARLGLSYTCNVVFGYAAKVSAPVIDREGRRTRRPAPLDTFREAVAVAGATLPHLPYYTSETPCTPMVGQTYEALEPHMVSCGEQHALAALRLTREGCSRLNATEPERMHFVFTCVGVARHRV